MAAVAVEAVSVFMPVYYGLFQSGRMCRAVHGSAICAGGREERRRRRWGCIETWQARQTRVFAEGRRVAEVERVRSRRGGTGRWAQPLPRGSFECKVAEGAQRARKTKAALFCATASRATEAGSSCCRCGKKTSEETTGRGGKSGRARLSPCLRTKIGLDWGGSERDSEALAPAGPYWTSGS